MSKGSKFVVSTSGNRSLIDIKDELSDHGFKVEHTLDAIGCFTGEFTDDEDPDSLKSIPGVIDVSPEPEPVDVGPPNSSMTW